MLSIHRNLPKSDPNRVTWRFRRFGGHRLWVIHAGPFFALLGQKAPR